MCHSATMRNTSLSIGSLSPHRKAGNESSVKKPGVISSSLYPENVNVAMLSPHIRTLYSYQCSWATGSNSYTSMLLGCGVERMGGGRVIEVTGSHLNSLATFIMVDKDPSIEGCSSTTAHLDFTPNPSKKSGTNLVLNQVANHYKILLLWGEVVTLVIVFN